MTAERHGSGMGYAAKHHVGHLRHLLGQRPVQSRMVIAVDRRPPRGHAVDQLTAIGQLQLETVCGNHRVTGQGGLH